MRLQARIGQKTRNDGELAVVFVLSGLRFSEPIKVGVKAMDHLEPLRRRIRSAAIADPPPPWKYLTIHAVGGLTEVGFAEDSDFLLVVSSQGRGVINCRTGERVARDRSEPEDSWYDPRRLRAQGIGPLENRTVRLAGLHGGGLPVCGQAAGRWNRYASIGPTSVCYSSNHGILFSTKPRRSRSSR